MAIFPPEPVELGPGAVSAAAGTAVSPSELLVVVGGISLMVEVVKVDIGDALGEFELEMTAVFGSGEPVDGDGPYVGGVGEAGMSAINH
jgi:hypothetical protein